MYFANSVGLLKLYDMINLLYFCSIRDFIALFNDVFYPFSVLFIHGKNKNR